MPATLKREAGETLPIDKPRDFRIDPTDGENHRQAKLTNRQAVLIVKAAGKGVAPSEIAELMGLDARQVRKIVQGALYGKATLEVRAEIMKQKASEK